MQEIRFTDKKYTLYTNKQPVGKQYMGNEILIIYKLYFNILGIKIHMNIDFVLNTWH